jgi:quercetin dioxygenase-like cupin family protein
VGASPELCRSHDAPPQRITGICVCGPIYGRTRSRRSGAQHGCRICRTEIKWTLRDIKSDIQLRIDEIRLTGDEHLKGRRGRMTGSLAVSPHGLQIASWAEPGELVADTQQLMVGLGPRPATLAHSPATGQALASNGQLGVDLIRLEAGKGFQPHTHPGDHVLIVVGGEGTITYDGVVYPTHSGDLYMIDGHVPHAVGARTDHVILAVGSPHRPVDATDRMEPVEYREVLSALGDLRCLTCGIESAFPRMLHDVACPHCPCSECTMDKTHHQTI